MRVTMKNNIVIRVIFITLYAGSVFSASDLEYLQFIKNNGAMVLQTYRVPEEQDLSYWGSNRDTYIYKTRDSDSEKKAPYWTKGYFNADKQPDYLYILFHRAQNKAHLIGFMSTTSGYESISIEPSSKYMAVATKQNVVGHYHLEGHGHGLSWNEKESKFNVIQ